MNSVKTKVTIDGVDHYADSMHSLDRGYGHRIELSLSIDEKGLKFQGTVGTKQRYNLIVDLVPNAISVSEMELVDQQVLMDGSVSVQKLAFFKAKQAK